MIVIQAITAALIVAALVILIIDDTRDTRIRISGRRASRDQRYARMIRLRSMRYSGR